MIFCLMSSMGSVTLQEALSWTYRQVGCFWERYLHKQQWDVKMQIDLNPFLSRKKGSKTRTGETVKAAEMSIEEMKARGIPVRTKKGK